MTRLSKLKISWRRGKQYAFPVTLGGGISKSGQIFTKAPRQHSLLQQKNQGRLLKVRQRERLAGLA